MDEATRISKQFCALERLVETDSWSTLEVLRAVRSLKTEVLLALGRTPPEEDQVKVGQLQKWP